jgi:tRNA pseudouridine38-40 synthase
MRRSQCTDTQGQIVALATENASIRQYLASIGTRAPPISDSKLAPSTICWKCGGSGWKPAKKASKPKKCGVCTHAGTTCVPAPIACRAKAKPPALLSSGTMPLLLRMEYDGTGFIGSQSQPASQGRTIQRILEEAASRLTGEANLRVVLAGRTDKGVHANGMAVLLWTATPLTPAEFRRNLNLYLPDDMACIEVTLVIDAAFNPRTDASYKWYRYSCTCGAVRSVIGRGHEWHIPVDSLDIDSMRTAAAHLTGRPLDFTSFTNVSADVRAMGEGEWDPTCTLYSVVITTLADPGAPGAITAAKGTAGAAIPVTTADEGINTTGEAGASEHGSGGSRCDEHGPASSEVRQLLTIDFRGNRFLYKMVRVLVGTLIAVGRGQMVAEEMPRVLEARNRDAAGPGAPAKGLCLQWVYYRPYV